jgi:hypothetical protein
MKQVASRTLYLSPNMSDETSNNTWHVRPCCNSSGYSLASQRGGPSSSPVLDMWELWWRKWNWGRFSPSTSVSPAKLHSTNCSTITIIYHQGWYNRPIVAALPSGLSPTPVIEGWHVKTSQVYSYPIQKESDIELGNVLQGRNIPSAQKTGYLENKLKIL